MGSFWLSLRPHPFELFSLISSYAHKMKSIRQITKKKNPELTIRRLMHEAMDPVSGRAIHALSLLDSAQFDTNRTVSDAAVNALVRIATTRKSLCGLVDGYRKGLRYESRELSKSSSRAAKALAAYQERNKELTLKTTQLMSQ